MTYCVLYQDGWHLALMTGRKKDVFPETFRRVRDACREAMRLNAAVAAQDARYGEEAA